MVSVGWLVGYRLARWLGAGCLAGPHFPSSLHQQPGWLCLAACTLLPAALHRKCFHTPLLTSLAPKTLGPLGPWRGLALCQLWPGLFVGSGRDVGPPELWAWGQSQLREERRVAPVAFPLAWPWAPGQTWDHPRSAAQGRGSPLGTSGSKPPTRASAGREKGRLLVTQLTPVIELALVGLLWGLPGCGWCIANHISLMS